MCYIVNNTTFVNNTLLRMRIEWLIVGFVAYCFVFTWDIPLWRGKEHSRQSQQLSCCCCCCEIYCYIFGSFTNI